MSDSDSSLSDYTGKKPVQKKRRFQSSNSSDESDSDDETFTFTKQKFNSNKADTSNVTADDSDSDDSVLCKIKETKKKVVLKKSSDLLDDSDSDNDVVESTKGKTFAASNSKKDAIMFSDSDSDNDNHNGTQIAESEVIKKARLAREALEQDVDLLNDDDDDDDHEDYTFQMPVISKPPAPKPVVELPVTGPVIRLQFRVNIASAPLNHGGKALHGKSIVLSFRTGTKFQAVMNKYRERMDPTITKHATVKFMFDGLAMKMERTIAQNEMEDEDMIDVTISIPANAPSSKPPQTLKENSIDANYVKVVTRIKGGDPSKSHTFQLKSCDPLDKILKAYREMHGYSTLKIIRLEMNGRQIEETSKSPEAIGIVGSCEIYICDEQQRVKQIQRMPQAATASTMGSVGGMKVKIRVNGSDKMCHNFSILPKEPFQKLIDWVCQKHHVQCADCKFEFDGAPLDPRVTPEDEDLEGGELFEVQIEKSALERGNKIAATETSSAAETTSATEITSKLRNYSVASTSRKLVVIGSLGVTVNSVNGRIRVKTIDSEKMKGKLFPGDHISHANGKEIIGMSPRSFATFLKSVGERREFTVQSLGTQDMPSIATKQSSEKKVSMLPTITASSKSNGVTSTPQAAVASTSNGIIPMPKAVVPVYVVRNNATTGKARKFKLYTTHKLLKLRQGYLKVYSKVGCTSVKFYLKDTELTDNTVTIGSLNLKESDRVVAMENGKPL